METLLSYLNVSLCGILGAAGFAMVFNVPRRIITFCILGGALATITRKIFLDLHLPPESSAFIAALVVGLWSILWIHRVHTPATVIAIAAAIPLVPGAALSKALTGVVALNHLPVAERPQSLVAIFSNGLQGIFILLAISVGVSMPIIADRLTSERIRLKRGLYPTR